MLLMLDNDQKEVDTFNLSTRTTANRCSEERSHEDEEREEEDGKRGERASVGVLGVGCKRVAVSSHHCRLCILSYRV